MKSKRLLLTLLMALLVPWAAMGQTSLTDYTLSTDVTTFNSIVSTGTKLSLSDNDDGSAAITFPFAFHYGTSNFAAGTSIACSSNGFIQLGATSNSSTTASYSSTNRFITPLPQFDGHMGRYTDAGVYWKYDQTAGTLTIEYHKLGAYSAASSTYGIYSYQIVFHNNGDIEFIYDEVDHQSATSRTMATYLTDGQNNDRLYVTGAWADPTKSTSYATRPFTPVPEHGLRYTFTRPVIAYPKPGNFHVTGSDHESVSLAWTAPDQSSNTLTGYAYQYKKASDTDWPTSWTNDIDASATTLTIHELNASTSYNFRLKALYGSNESDIVTTDGATTAQATAVGDSWSDDFEGDACGWELINGTITNANWAWGTAVNNGGTHSIYISKDGGTTNSYNASGYARVYATKLLSFADSKYTFTFDWKCYGEVSSGTSYDYLSVGLLPATVQLTADNNSSTSLPDGWIPLHDASYLAAQTEWQTAPDKTIQVVAGNYYLVLRWRQDSSTSYGVPAAVDNVSITRVTCPYDVTGLVVATDPAVTAHTATINWTAGDATQWQIAWSKDSNFATSETAIVSSPTKALENLDADSRYYVKVRAYCGGNDYGTWCGSIYFDTPATCIQPTWPTEGAVANISTDEATLTWIAGSTEQDLWDIYYSTSSVAPTTETVLDETNSIQNTSTNPYTLTGLTPATDYYVWVRGNCGNGDFSAWSAMASFQTNCDAYTLPYDYDFETAAKMKCWTMNNCYSSTGRYYGSGYNSSSYSFRFYYSYSYTPQYLISPELIGTTSGVRVEFYYKGYSGWSSTPTQKFMVGYSTTDNAVESFTWDDEISFSSSSYSLFTNDYPAGTKYVAIKYTTTSSDYMYIDNIRLTASPTCREPKLLTCDSKTAHTATLSWTNGAVGQNAWQIVYSTQYDFDPDAATPADVTSNPVTIEGLTHNTTYYAYVRANCGNEDYSAWSNKCTFSTTNATVAPSTPYEVDGTLTYNSITIGWSAVASNDHHSSYELYYSTNMFMPDELIQDNLITGITETTYPLSGLTEETPYYVWVRDNCGDDGISPWSSRFSFDTPEVCPAPVLNNPTNITAHGATFSWTGSYDSYDVMYRIPAYTTGGISEDFESGSIGEWTKRNCQSSTGITYDETHNNSQYAFIFYYGYNSQYLISPVLDGITEGMTCEFYYKNYSTYTETFKVGYSTTTNETSAFTFGDEYSVNDGQEWHQFSEPMPAGTKYVCIQYTSYDQYYLYIDDITIGNPTIVPATQWVAVAENITANTVTLDDATLFAGSTSYEVEVVATCNIVNPAVEVESNVKTFTTDIACPAPTALQTVEGTLKSSEVGLSWTNGGAENWVLAYKKTADENFTEVNLGTTDVTIEGTTVTYTLTDLDEETPYTVKVRDNCEASIAGDGVSEWTTEVSFTTIAACSAMDPVVSDIKHYTATVNWNGESATGFTVNYRTAAGTGAEFGEDFENGIGSWTMVSCAYSTGLNSSVNHTEGGSQCFRFYYNSNPPQYLISPELTGNIDGKNLEFYYKQHSTSYPESFKVGYSSTTSGTDAFTFGDEITMSDTDWHLFSETVPSGTKYICIQYTSDDQYYLYIDDITIGAYEVPAGEPQTVAATATTANLEGLTAGQKYDLWVVPNCDKTLASEIKQFTTVSGDIKWFITEGNWDVDANWEPAGAPTIEQDVVLKANATIASGEAFAKSIAGTGTGDDAKTLTIENGAKLKHLNSSVRATVKKHINSYTNYTGEGNGGYYLIANPMTSSVTPSAENGFLVGNYDLYSWSYDAYDGNEWRNYEAGSFTDLNSGEYGAYGYLYANEAGTDLTYTGTINAYTSYKYRSASVATNPDSYSFPSWYLLGNPYLYDAYLANSSNNGTALPYIKMNADGDGFEAVAAGTPIEPMQGFFYQGVTGASYAYVVTYEPTVQDEGKLNMNLRKGNKQLDNAILVFGGEQQMSKMTFRANSSKIYMPVEGKDFAIASTESNVGEMPVNFKAEKDGSYTLSFTSQEVSFSYLHLIDNMTGADVDLLANPSYSFNALTTDYASRFRLVFATGSSIDGDSFGFINGAGNLNIFGIEGEATVQVIDVLGHVISSDTFSGSYERKLNVAPGVYMIRLIQGNDVKVQKIVVR